MIERTNDSLSLFYRETAQVLWKSLPILLSQAAVAGGLVYIGQGRAFLFLDEATALLYLIALSAMTTVVFSRVLASRVDPDPSPDPECTDRLRWLALQCGSSIAGLVSGFLPVALIETFVSSSGGEIPRQVLDSYRGSAAAVTLLVILVLDAYLLWRTKYRKDERTNLRDLGLVLVVLASGWIANKVSASYHLAVLGFIIIAATALLTSMVLKGPRPTKARGGILEWRAASLAVLFVIAGLFVAVFPTAMPSGVALWVIAQFWTAIVLLITVGLRRLWVSHLAWFFVVCMVLVAVVVGFSSRAFQARDIRALDNDPPLRPTLNDYAEAWLLDRSAKIHSPRPYPIFLVAAAGGGIRAAYWTANLLSAFEDREPAFAGHVFAISGVSGGSVGATIFDALVKAGCNPCRPRAHEILGRDFLAPALSVMLTRDLISTTFRVNLPDRGIALENAFEHAWRDSMHTTTLEEAFPDLWRTPAPYAIPALFLNSTEAGSARRAVFSNVAMADVVGDDRTIQVTAEAQPVRLSTAMILSARFPYISPEAKGEAPQVKGETAPRAFRFVDGGYFDNSGAGTLLDVAAALQKAITDLKAEDEFQIVTLVIQNEPVAVAGCCRKDAVGGFSTPLTILDELRAQRADEFTRQLRTLIAKRPGDAFLESFRPQSGSAEFPLGWTLPKASAKEMDAQIDRRMQDDSSPMLKLLAELR